MIPLTPNPNSRCCLSLSATTLTSYALSAVGLPSSRSCSLDTPLSSSMLSIPSSFHPIPDNVVGTTLRLAVVPPMLRSPRDRDSETAVRADANSRGMTAMNSGRRVGRQAASTPVVSSRKDQVAASTFS